MLPGVTENWSDQPAETVWLGLITRAAPVAHRIEHALPRAMGWRFESVQVHVRERSDQVEHSRPSGTDGNMLTWIRVPERRKRGVTLERQMVKPPAIPVRGLCRILVT